MNLRKFYLGRTIGFIVILVLALVFFTVSWYVKNKSIKTTGELPPDVKNIAYTINDGIFSIKFVLKNGQAESAIPESAGKNTLTMFGEPVYGDLDTDGDQDAAVLLVNQLGGSGVFYYAALAMKNSDGSYQATNALLLGDRIAPQTVEIHDGQAVYNYAERKPNEPMTSQPSIGQSLYVQYDQATKQISVKPSEAVFCTMEAKECPDGSYVGRTGPKCEFSPCPTVDLTAELKKLFSLKYPEYTGTIVVRIDKQTADHVRGGVTFVDDQEGGIFLATKIAGQWQIVFDGNGAIPCNLSKYGFNSEMLADCQ